MENKTKILLAEDDENLGTLLRQFMNAKGFKVDLAEDGKKALELFHGDNYQFIVLDVMMPEMDGFSVAKEIRSTNKDVPILFLTAKAMKEDKLEGFDLGADDYLTKPFSMEELIARVNAIMRRSGVTNNEEPTHYKIGLFDFNAEKRLLQFEGNSDEKLTTKENHLLKLLAQNKNDILERKATLRAVWGDDNYYNGRSMDVYIAKLRKMLKKDPSIEIMNVHGKGFKLIAD